MFVNQGAHSRRLIALLAVLLLLSYLLYSSPWNRASSGEASTVVTTLKDHENNAASTVTEFNGDHAANATLGVGHQTLIDVDC